MKQYFDEFAVGDRFTSSGRTVTEADITAFAGLSGDFNPLHTDEQWVRANTPYDGRIAHGLLIHAISTGLRTPGLDAMHVLAFLETQRRMLAPTYPGDTLTMVQAVVEARPSRSRPGAGILAFEVTMTKQDGTVVQQGLDHLLVGGRPEEEA
jgi:3-hydroxybutyryl-CoA dehydratase